MKAGSISRIVGGRVEVLSEFEQGNNGGPVFDSTIGAVIGVITYSESHGITPTSTINLEDVTPRLQGAEVRWYVSRLDTVSKWETVNPVQWRRQAKQIGEFRKDSLALVALLHGELVTARSQPGIAKFLDRFLLNLAPPSLASVIVSDPRFEGASVIAVQRLLHDTLEYAEASNLELTKGTFYDYFHSNLFWETNLTEQIKYRKLIIESLKNVQSDLNLQDQLFHAYYHPVF